MISNTDTTKAGTTASAAPAAYERCRLCDCRFSEDEDDDPVRGVCSSCKTRPEARRLGDVPAGATAVPDTSPRIGPRPAREFTAAEKSLISKVHGYMPPQQLLDLLNERLVCDLGPDAVRYSMDQLHKQIGNATATPAGGHDWASLRKLLVQAKRSGVLDQVNEQVINDFAVVFSLNPKQVLGLKDIVLAAKEEE